MRDLLGAAARADFARANMARLGDEQGTVAAKEMLKEVKSRFLEKCHAEHSERFCELKLKYPSWPDAVVQRVVEHKLLVGMTSDHVFESWGRPTRLGRAGAAVRYCYGQFCGKSVRMINRVVVGVDE